MSATHTLSIPMVCMVEAVIRPVQSNGEMVRTELKWELGQNTRTAIPSRSGKGHEIFNYKAHSASGHLSAAQRPLSSFQDAVFANNDKSAP